MSQAGVPQDFRIHLHCYNGDWDLCQRWLNKYSGCKIGITGLVTYDWKEKLRDVVKKVPLEKYFLYTTYLLHTIDD